jgi:hypothetical protein
MRQLGDLEKERGMPIQQGGDGLFQQRRGGRCG